MQANAKVSAIDSCRLHVPPWSTQARWEKISDINDAFGRVIGILVNWHISTVYLTRIACAILVKIPVGMCQFTRIPMTRLSVSIMLVNFCQCNKDVLSRLIENYWIRGGLWGDKGLWPLTKDAMRPLRWAPCAPAPCCTLRKLVFHFLSNWMGYNRGESFPSDFLNQIDFNLV